MLIVVWVSGYIYIDDVYFRTLDTHIPLLFLSIIGVNSNRTNSLGPWVWRKVYTLGTGCLFTGTGGGSSGTLLPAVQQEVRFHERLQRGQAKLLRKQATWCEQQFPVKLTRAWRGNGSSAN